ncbi:MAG TPA: hypothetical protein VFA89_18790 [Terriglobales bacterium]|nr:hypothetical protein [Terriglobales bacterium]
MHGIAKGAGIAFATGFVPVLVSMVFVLCAVLLIGVVREKGVFAIDLRVFLKNVVIPVAVFVFVITATFTFLRSYHR